MRHRKKIVFNAGVCKRMRVNENPAAELLKQSTWNRESMACLKLSNINYSPKGEYKEYLRKPKFFFASHDLSSTEIKSRQ